MISNVPAAAFKTISTPDLLALSSAVLLSRRVRADAALDRICDVLLAEVARRQRA